MQFLNERKIDVKCFEKIRWQSSTFLVNYIYKDLQDKSDSLFGPVVL